MLVVSTVREMKSLVSEERKKGKTIGLVPTMGFLHQGHLTLMRTAKEMTNFVVSSIFVNPLQFGAGEDYEDYPRDLSHDTLLAEGAGVDVIFAPTVREMYPKKYSSFVEVENLTNVLCGKSRPGHFRGVTTVVTKLFNIVQPDVAFFGQKDAQQALVLKKMVEDLNMNLEIEVVPIVREADGIAMSSRNTYLSPEERRAALVLSQSLERARQLVKNGETNTERIVKDVVSFISQEPLARIDYAEVLSLPGLEASHTISGQALCALAVYIGSTRLIDNTILEA